ncbi:MAG: OmpA family protein [Bacteroidia bacterium]
MPGPGAPAGSHLFINIANKDSTLRVADRNGRFAIKLSRKRLRPDRHASRLPDLTSPGQTEMTQYDGDTVIPLELEMIRLNEAIVLKNIHYDYDKWYIRDDAIPDLLHLCKLLGDNPSIKIELSSHTDCRGSDEYNRVLSNKRAWSAAAFLIEQGIDSSQILPNGYGETRLVNGCDDGVDCDEDKHFANRRTEFAIVGFIGENGQATVLKSVAEDPTAPPKYVPEAGREWFSKPTLPDAAYGKGQYRILAGSFDRKLNRDELRPFFEYDDKVVMVQTGGQYQYFVGDYNTSQGADRAMRHLRTYGWKNAIVVDK